MDKARLPPFQVRVLDSAANPLESLPATVRTKTDNIAVPAGVDMDFLEREFLVPRLNAVHKHFWLVGRPMPPRPLHAQLTLRRDIIVTENMDLHLVWARNRIFLKPIPEYLLDPDFWTAHLLPQATRSTRADGDNRRRLQEVEACVRGFLFTYCALLSYPSDFRIAKERGLVPEAVTWAAWKRLAAEFVSQHCYAAVNARFWYGELRLSRLNKIYRLTMAAPLRGFSTVERKTVLGDLFYENLAVFASVMVYAVIVLTAMQVGLETTALQGSEAFQGASYGFTVFSIIAPLVAVAVITGGSVVLVVSNVLITKAYESWRFKEMGIDGPSRRQTRVATGKQAED